MTRIAEASPAGRAFGAAAIRACALCGDPNSLHDGNWTMNVIPPLDPDVRRRRRKGVAS